MIHNLPPNRIFNVLNDVENNRKYQEKQFNSKFIYEISKTIQALPHKGK